MKSMLGFSANNDLQYYMLYTSFATNRFALICVLYETLQLTFETNCNGK